MCEWGNSQMVRVKINAGLSFSGEERWDDKAIDACIAPIVKALQGAGIDMLASCCGHGDTLGRVDLVDGRVLLIAPSLESAEEIRSLYDESPCHQRPRNPQNPSQSPEPT